METENIFELGNEETKFSIEFGDTPTFYISKHNLQGLSVEFEEWTCGFLKNLGYDGEIEDLKYEMAEGKDEVNIAGSFGTLVIKNNGGMEYTRNDESL